MRKEIRALDKYEGSSLAGTTITKADVDSRSKVLELVIQQGKVNSGQAQQIVEAAKYASDRNIILRTIEIP